MNDFSVNLRIAMAVRDVSQSALAERLDVSRAFMSAVCSGQKMLSSGRLVHVARILDVSIDYLMGGNDVAGQIEDVLKNRMVRKTARQLYEDAQSIPQRGEVH